MFAGGWGAAVPGPRSATPPPPAAPAARPGQRNQPRWGDGRFISADTEAEEFIFVV